MPSGPPLLPPPEHHRAPPLNLGTYKRLLDFALAQHTPARASLALPRRAWVALMDSYTQRYAIQVHSLEGHPLYVYVTIWQPDDPSRPPPPWSWFERD